MSTGLLDRLAGSSPPHDTVQDGSEPGEDQSRWRQVLFGHRASKEPKGPKPVTASTMGRRTSSIRWIMTGALALVPVTLIVSLLAWTRDMPDPLPPVPVTVDVNAGVGGWAENFVATYLSADSTQLNAVRQFYPDASRLPVDGVDLYVARTATVSLQAVADNHYTALVSADVLEDLTDDDEGYIDAGTRFYTVGIQQVANGFVATSLPAQVAAPPTLLVPNRVLPELGRPDGDVAELADALAGFFDAYLANGGDLDRYADLSSGLTRVDPAPFEWTEIGGISARLRSGNLWLVQVEVLAGNDSGTQNFHYSLDVVEGNRWEVLRVLPGLPHEFVDTTTPTTDLNEEGN